MEWLVPIAVAVISGPIVVLLQHLRKENTSQHAESRGLLEHIVRKVDRMDERLDDHMSTHHTGPKTRKKVS